MRHQVVPDDTIRRLLDRCYSHDLAKSSQPAVQLGCGTSSNESATGRPPVPESATASASWAAAAGNTGPGWMPSLPASTSSNRARSWDPSDLTYRLVIVICRSLGGGSSVIVVRRPPSRTRRTADAAPPGTAFTAASNPPAPAVAAAASAHSGSW